MRIALVLVLTLIAANAQADPNDTPFWTPDMPTVVKLEQTLVMPAGVQKPLEAYGRYYSGITKDGKRVIHGIFVMPQISNKFPGIYVVAERDLPGIDDGGCGVIDLLYDVDAGKIVAIECNGIA